MRWTPDQEQILYIHGHRGPEYCRNLIYKVFGVYRSVEATKRHASRINASMTIYQTCPVCGRVERKLNRNSGICEVCNYELLWREQVKEEQRIREQLSKGGDNYGAIQAKRKYDAQRQKVNRLRRRCEDCVDLSRKMSPTSSGHQKNFQSSLFNAKEMRTIA